MFSENPLGVGFDLGQPSLLATDEEQLCSVASLSQPGQAAAQSKGMPSSGLGVVQPGIEQRSHAPPGGGEGAVATVAE